MVEPFQKGNSKEYVREWERIFRGQELKYCKKCGEVPRPPYPLYCLACGEKLEVSGDE